MRTFHDRANSIHPNIKVDLRVSESCIEFLDVKVRLSGSGHIATNLFSKPTDAHAYLHYASDHPPHVKTATPTGLGIRMKRICSNQLDYQRHGKKITNRLSDRGYPRKEIDCELKGGPHEKG